MDENNSYDIYGRLNQNNPNTNLIDKFISDKIGLLEVHINEISKLVDERKSLEEITKSELNDEILNIHNKVLAIQSFMPKYTPYSDPRITEFEKEIITLQKSRINGKIESWRDVLLLKRDIINLIMKLKKIQTRLELIDNRK